MIKSMTGYGRSAKENGNFKVTVEMKAVNHRFCEINIRMPRQLLFLEDRLKKAISRYVKRGKVDVFLNLQGESIVKRSLSIDWDLFHQYHHLYEQMVENTVASEAFPIDRLLLHEEVVSVKESDEVSKELEEMVKTSVDEAVSQLIKMRQSEGRELLEDLSHRLQKLSDYLEQLRTFAPQVQELYRERLLKKVESFMEGNTEIDESRILTEVSVYADKSDVEEELTRIDSHLKQFSSILNDGEVVGRKLDFLVQELNREINTIGSKANHLDVSQIVVNLKADLEKIREQVQNVE
ncbi:YicC/YloC family endoribonuclease [Salipaludibacillus aurantiacus]|uniref:TIGR00255 family protein n=1 Tax=Salipaludibacillus aurantiacus TaxID=1601833 RepID=A0A1H9QQR6_9BACI|nr:YicC/YloC family endoribonuclease [Salipaludibacillus aurantiacus]SER62788.1 TIGR00255 family protein [Salipaludibacillus aurantiacus]